MTDHTQRAEVLLRNRRFDLAEKELEVALEIDPENPRLHALLAICLAHRSEFHEADDHVRAAFRSSPNLAVVHHCAAAVALLENRLEAAAIAIATALELDVASVESWVLQAQIQIALRRFDEALDGSARALELEPDCVAIRVIRAAAFLHLQRSRAATREIDEAMAIDPENAPARAMSGWLHLDRAKRDQALEHFRESLRTDPLSASAQKGFSRTLMESTLLYRLFLAPYLAFSRFFDQPVWLLIATVAAFDALRRHVGPKEPALLSEPAIPFVFLAFLVSGVIVAPVLGIVVLRLMPRTRRNVLDFQRSQNNWIIGLLAIATASAVFGSIWDAQLCSELAVVGGLCMFPVNAVFRARNRLQQSIMAVYSLVFVTSGAAFAIWAAIQRNESEAVGSETHAVALVVSALLPLAALLSTRVSEVVSRQHFRAGSACRHSPTRK